jgi:hypothetical protein
MVQFYTTGYRPNKLTGKYEAYKMPITAKRQAEIEGWCDSQYGNM